MLQCMEMGFIVYGSDDSPVIPLLIFHPSKIPYVFFRSHFPWSVCRTTICLAWSEDNLHESTAPDRYRGALHCIAAKCGVPCCSWGAFPDCERHSSALCRPQCVQPRDAPPRYRHCGGGLPRHTHHHLPRPLLHVCLAHTYVFAFDSPLVRGLHSCAPSASGLQTCAFVYHVLWLGHWVCGLLSGDHAIMR